MENEIWKFIPDNDEYEVSNYSRIRKNGEIIEPRDDRRNNHLCIKIGTKRYSIYALAWEAFNGPIPNGYVLHHIDFNPLNNKLDNLQMMTRGEHVKLHRKGKKYKESFNSKTILQFDKQGNFIKEWPASEAANTYGFGIYDCANESKPAKTAYGFVWKYKDDCLEKYKRE